MSKKVKLTINFEVPENVSSEAILEWVDYNIGASYNISVTNALVRNDFQELVDDFRATFGIVIKGREIN